MNEINYQASCKLDRKNLSSAKNPGDLIQLLRSEIISVWGFCGAATNMLLANIDLKAIAGQVITTRGKVNTVVVDGHEGVSLQTKGVYSKRFPYDL